MAQYDTQYASTPEVPRGRGRWPLAGVMALDLVIMIVAVLVTVSLIQGIFLGIKAERQGINLADLRSLGPERLTQLVGIGGIFAAVLVQNLVFIIVPIVRVATLRREPLAEIGFQARRLPLLILLGLGLGVLTLIGNAVLGLLFQQLGIRQNQAAQYPLYAGDYLGQMLFFLAAAVLAPIGEEVLFRGYVFNALRQTFQTRRWGMPLAFILSALAFSLAHSLAATEGIIGLLVPTFVMGLVLAWGMYRTGSLIPGIIAHAINNGVALTALIVCINNPGSCPNI